MKGFPGEMVIANSFSRDGRFAILRMTSDLTPPRYYLFDRDSKKLSLLISARPKLKPDQLASMEPIQFTERDGLAIHGFLTTPTATAKPWPLVVMVHGGSYDIGRASCRERVCQYV